MDGMNWEEVRRVFLDAASCDPATRAIFLDAACGTNVQLRAEVESLLDHHQMAQQEGFSLPPSEVARP